MTKLILVLATTLAMTACSKKATTPPAVVPVVMQTDSLLATGNFSSNAHTTSGNVKICKGTSGNYIAFSNFKTDAGPDLRVYLSKNTNASDFIELGTLTATSGSFNYSIPANTNIADYKYALIWCQDFSVLFGNALLQ
jgi:hypothetical protein